MAHCRRHRHCHRGLYRQLAVPSLVEGSVVRPHRLPRRARRHQRWRLRAAVHSRLHAGQHERAADGDHALQAGRRHHPRPHAHRHRGRFLRARAGDPRGGRHRRLYARSPHAGAGKTAHAVVRQVRVGAALGRLGNDDGADARAARRICRAAEAGGRRGAGAERSRTGIGRHHRPRPDRPRILQPVEPLRRRGPDAADGGHRGQAQAAQRHRAGLDDQDPHAQSGSGAAGPRYRAPKRDGAAGTGARHRHAARLAAHRGRARAGAARH